MLQESSDLLDFSSIRCSDVVAIFWTDWTHFIFFRGSLVAPECGSYIYMHVVETAVGSRSGKMSGTSQQATDQAQTFGNVRR